jgi:hypothetical protein
VVGRDGGGPAACGCAGVVVTYGTWLDQARGDLAAAHRTVVQASVAEFRDAAEVVAERDGCVRCLYRLAGLLGGVGAPSTAAVGAVKDPTAQAVLRALPTAIGTAPSVGDTGQRSAASRLLRSAAQAAGVAGDILASHVDPINGPRTPEGAAIRLGAGRYAALAEIAGCALDLVQIDRELLAWLQRSMLPDLWLGSSLHHALTTGLQDWGVDQLAAVASLPREPPLVRQLEVAAVLGRPTLPRTPDTAAQCADLIDDFRLWAYRHPEQVSGAHLSAATRVGLLIATLAPDRVAADARAGWRRAVQALSNIAAPAPRDHDLRAAELGHVADLLRANTTDVDRYELVEVAGRLPRLADTLDEITRQLVYRGALLTKQKTLEHSRTRAGVVPAVGRWVTATPGSPAVTTLLAEFEDAAEAADRSRPSQVRRAFPPLPAVTEQRPTRRQDQPPHGAGIRSIRR